MELSALPLSHLPFLPSVHSKLWLLLAILVVCLSRPPPPHCETWQCEPPSHRSSLLHSCLGDESFFFADKPLLGPSFCALGLSLCRLLFSVSVCCIFWFIYRLLIVAPHACQESRKSRPCIAIMRAPSQTVISNIHECMNIFIVEKSLCIRERLISSGESLNMPHVLRLNTAAGATSCSMDKFEVKEVIALLLEGLGQSLQSGMPSSGFNRPSLCIRCASCDEPLKGCSSKGWEIAIASHGCVCVSGGWRRCPLLPARGSTGLWRSARFNLTKLDGNVQNGKAAMWRDNSCRVTFGFVRTHKRKVVWMCVACTGSGVSCGWLVQIKVWVCVTDGSNNDQIALVMETAQSVMAS